MGLTVTTDDKGTMIFRNEKTTSSGVNFYTYSTTISSKDSNDEWIRGYIDVAFKKGVVVNNKAKIKIKNSFFVASKYKDKVYTKLMITDFDVIEQGEAAEPQPRITDDGFMNIPEGFESEMPAFFND